MSKLGNWLFKLFELFGSQRGDTQVAVPEKTKEEENNEEVNEEIDEEIDEDDGEDGVDVDDGNNDGKERSKFIPRERFDQVNAKAKQLERLSELGILEEDENGDFHVNKEALNQSKKEDKSSDRSDFRFKKEDVDDASWPLVEKINKGFDYYAGLANQMAYALQTLQSENAILKDYPEFLQKDGQLRKKTMDLLKNDPEFKKKYKGDPERGYWAVKRAAELISGNQEKPVKKKPKSKFIVGRGDAGKTGKKMVDISTLTGAQLDEMEKSEHERMAGSRKV